MAFMNNNPKVSIIIPVYNTEQYLRQCLDSVINQTLKDIEIIIINDNSTDNSLQIIQEYANKHKNIKVIDNKKNEGMYKSRNLGLEIAAGQYIGFIDSDDYIENNMYETMYLKAKETDADIISCNYSILFNNTKGKEKLTKIDFFNSRELLRISKNKLIGAEEILFDTPVAWNKIFKKNFLTENNIIFDPQIKTTYDAYFNRICFFKANKIVYIPEFLYIYRKFRKESIRNIKNITNIYDFFTISQNLINYVKENNLETLLPYCNYIAIRTLYLVYPQIQNDYKNEFFNKMHEFLKNNSIKSIKQFYFKNRKTNLISLSYYKHLTVKGLNILIIKTIINKNMFLFDIIIRLREIIVRTFKI